MCSIIIPAHNESASIDRCLNSLAAGLDSSAEIIVVSNGCSDDTAERARKHEGVKVIDTPVGSKIHALNLGDEAATRFPRVYLDADIVLSGADLLKCLEQGFASGDHQAISPSPTFDVSRSSWLVRAFYRYWQKLPYLADGGMIGSGVFILSERGRQRFDRFPDVIADDGYVRSLFNADERWTDPETHFNVMAPRDVQSLVSIKTRVRLGNMQIKLLHPELRSKRDNQAGSSVSVLLRRPYLILDALVYYAVQLTTLRKAKKRFSEGQFNIWDRDNSSRAS